MTPPAPGAAAARRGPGRPRSEAHDERILEVAVTLINRGEEVTVNRVVALSGVGRAAIYRRWTSMTDLLAAALDHGRDSHDIPLDGDLLDNVLTAYTEAAGAAGDDSNTRLRMRIRLAMTDRRLARAYWCSHVARRRSAMAAVLREGIARGELRPDLDVEACIDLLNGVFYYQYVARGVSANEPDALARCVTAIRVAWRGMTITDT